MPTPVVNVRRETVSLPTYEPLPPDKHPMFLEKRVYQGSSGKVYPLPFYNRISAEKKPRDWQAVFIDNGYVELMILPEIGGRIHTGKDLLNGYDFFYRQTSIKPALVGLAGPWASGGVEFNWPQHHRPATYMPVDVEIEEHADGSKTVWLSDHDPMSRMKGMHGVCLHPGKAIVELKVRAYNRTPMVQSFLWWANVATHVHEGYQSFFPPDVTHVADHAKRAISTYPLCTGTYYGVDYAKRASDGVRAEEVPANFIPAHCKKPAERNGSPFYAPNDLSWYANIPVPTSYMCIGSEQDFFGGYDHFRKAGLIHVANHHISPGKKQWTWGNQEFGYAWDRNLTDGDGPYIEIMAGVYTDNQPDFSFIGPGETKTWSQFWYPIREIGAAKAATMDAALSIHADNSTAYLGIHATEHFGAATLQTEFAGKVINTWRGELTPETPLLHKVRLPRGAKAEGLSITLMAPDGRVLVAYQPVDKLNKKLPAPATEPPAPQDVQSTDELYVIGLHLDQYRHATRTPADYWNEALRRDSGDSRCNNAIGLWHLRRGEFADAEHHFRTAIARLTERNPNPRDGEPYYNLGLTLVYLGRDADAYAAFYKATWDISWQASAYHSLAQLDCRKADWNIALDHLERALRLNTDNLRARDLKALVLRKLHRDKEANDTLKATLRVDPLDWWARHITGEAIRADTQTALDLALDYTEAGLFAEAIHLLKAVDTAPSQGAAPLLAYYLGWLHDKAGYKTDAAKWFKQASRRETDYCFPARLEEITILQHAISRNPKDAYANYYLGNLFYDKRRHADAIDAWERCAALDPHFSIVWRNLGIGYFNISKHPARAKAAYDKAIAANPKESRLLYERDQLWKRLRISPARRLTELEKHPTLVQERDDLSVELSALYNQTGNSEKALLLLNARKFQPWEGGEGLALGQHVRTHIYLARSSEKRGDLQAAHRHLEAALHSPENLGEARHPLANQSDVHYYLGSILAALGDKNAATKHWKLAANFRGDFQQMSVKQFSEMTYFSTLALSRLGRVQASKKLFRELLRYGNKLEKTKASIEYFATSLPTMLLFDEDIQSRQVTQALLIQAEARLGLGQIKKGRGLLDEVLKRDPSHPLAADLLSQLR
jgi:tetratricopeptide (TPR) repeat protein